MDVIGPIDLWINTVPKHPVFVIIGTSLIIGGSLIPEFWNWLGHHVAINRLWALRAEGSDMRNRANAITSEAAYIQWRKEYESWREEVLKNARKISIHFWNWLAIVNVMDTGVMPALVASYKDNQFVIDYMVTCETLSRMEKYLTKDLVA